MTIEKTRLGLAPFDSAVGGVYFDTPTLVRGRRGSGKTFLAIQFADKVLRTGESLLFYCESGPEAVVIDARSAGIDLETPARSGQLELVSVRSALASSPDGTFPLREALSEMRDQASRMSARFAVFSSAVTWLAGGPAAGMPARVEEFFAALSAASLTSLVLLHQPVSKAAADLVRRAEEECPVVLSMESFRHGRRELRVERYRGRLDLKLPMTFRLRLVAGKGLVEPEPEEDALSAAAGPDAGGKTGSGRPAGPAAHAPGTARPERPRRARTPLFSAGSPQAPDAERPRLGRTALFSALPQAPVQAPPPAPVPPSSAEKAAAPVPAPARKPEPSASPAAPQPEAARPRIRFSNVIR